MAKTSIAYVCRDCGAEHNKWSGKCDDCGAWNSLSEEARVKQTKSERRRGFAGAADGKVTSLRSVSTQDIPRRSFGMGELDRVLGGGLVPGSAVLIGGDPGIGKSTLLLQAVAAMAGQGAKPLYVTGEESLQQIALRAQRLGVAEGAADDDIQCLAETRVEAIIAQAQKSGCDLLVVDSIQTVFTGELQSAPGSVTQVREAAGQLVSFAKTTGTAVFLVGHVTKEGAIAGPRVLEHMVDAVLYFEGDPGGRYRVLRAVKNRFGAVNELGVFAMSDVGLKQVTNPSAIFLAGHPDPVAGSAVSVVREGTRALLVEVQALVSQSGLANPRRLAVGFDGARLNMLLAVLHRHADIALYDQDVFVNLVGGMRVAETGIDLAVAVAVLGSFRDRAAPDKTAIFGEIGLAGEVRPVYNGDERVREAVKHGFKRIIAPQGNLPRKPPSGSQLYGVTRIEQVMEWI